MHNPVGRVLPAIVLLAAAGCSRQPSEPVCRPYLNMKPPGAKAELFAPGIVSTGVDERDIAITPYGQEIYWGVSSPEHDYSTIVISRQSTEGWTPPRVAPHLYDPAVLHIEPAISPDGKQLFYTQVRPDATGSFQDSDIWVMARGKDGWSEPHKLGPAINTDAGEFFPSPTRSGALYFTREPREGGESGIFRSRLVNGEYQPAERLPVQVNAGSGRFNAFADRDERFLIVPIIGRPDSLGGVDYYVVFRNADDTWKEPINLGAEVNTAGSQEYSPYISPDGKYFFFMSSRRSADGPSRLTYKFFMDSMLHPRNGNGDIWWIDAGFIEKLRPVPVPVPPTPTLTIEVPPQSRHK